MCSHYEIYSIGLDDIEVKINGYDYIKNELEILK